MTGDMLHVATYQYYNAGNKGFYWIPNATFDGWLKNPSAAFRSYGDNAVAIEAAVKAGNPPELIGAMLAPAQIHICCGSVESLSASGMGSMLCASMRSSAGPSVAVRAS